MFIEERLEKILKLVAENGKLTVLEGSRIFGVSADTMRRDFTRLSNHGVVIRTHGGIISRKSVSFDPSITEKTVQHEDEKERIAKLASSLIDDSEIVIIDAGTTAERIIKHLDPQKNLTVLTDALNIALETTRRNIHTVILGGEIRNTTLSIIGPDAVEMADHYHADKLFLGLSAMSIVRGLMTPNRMEAEIKKKLIQIANQIVVIADYSKIDKIAFYSFASVEDIDVLITDANADKGFLAELRNYDIEVLIAE